MDIEDISKNKLIRIAIINPDKCAPAKCNLECKKSCPVSRNGKECIVVTKESKIAVIVESACIGCGICPTTCPRNAIQIINLPTNTNKDVIHRYGPNTFKLHRLPYVRKNQILGLVGANGLGKTTILNILAGKLNLNFGRFNDPPDKKKILTYFRGSGLQSFFANNKKVAIKPQHVNSIPLGIKKQLNVDKSSKLCGKTVSEYLLELNDVLINSDTSLKANNSTSTDGHRKFNRINKQKLANISNIDKIFELDDINLDDINLDNKQKDIENENIINSTDESKLIREKRINDAMELFELTLLANRDISMLSGGENQRFACCVVYLKDAELLLFDEPSNFLDVKQRIKIANNIKSLSSLENYVVVVEHDLSILDYISDSISILYGMPSVYGIVTLPYGVGEGINIYLDGNIPTENMRFRPESFTFRNNTILEETVAINYERHYPEMIKEYSSGFKLCVHAGTFAESHITVLLGENGTGKTTFVELIAGIIKSDNGKEIQACNISYKPQNIDYSNLNYKVRDLIHKEIGNIFTDPVFMSDIFNPLKINNLMDLDLKTLSGGESQRVAITIALGKNANIYLLDEPSAFLDSEYRMTVSKMIKRHIYHKKASAFIVEHDLLMTQYLADRIILFEGTPGVNCKASKPMKNHLGLNLFLKQLNITIRRDPHNFRPRINKLNGQHDQTQKKEGKYYDSRE